MILCRYFFVAICCVIPGGTLLLSRSLFLAFMTPAIGLLWVFFASQLRLLLTPEGFILLISGLLLLHIVTTIAGLWLLRQPVFHRNNYLHTLVFLSLLILFNALIMASSHLYKDRWFGFAFYHIPSASMSPTLQPGDVVLVDTWYYQSSYPEPEEIVIIRKQQNSFVMAKRVTDIRTNQGQLQLFVEGDNTARSVDSRRFGWLNHSLLLGRVQFVWFSFRNRERLLLTPESDPNGNLRK